MQNLDFVCLAVAFVGRRAFGLRGVWRAWRAAASVAPMDGRGGCGPFAVATGVDVAVASFQTTSNCAAVVIGLLVGAVVEVGLLLLL
jgi:hypothetical protein